MPRIDEDFEELIDEIQGAGDLGTDFKGAVLTFICFYAMSYKKNVWNQNNYNKLVGKSHKH